jgi:hypothetical protein
MTIIAFTERPYYPSLKLLVVWLSSPLYMAVLHFEGLRIKGDAIEWAFRGLQLSLFEWSCRGIRPS